METNYNLVWIVIGIVALIGIPAVGVLLKNRRSTGTGSTAPTTSATAPPTAPPAHGTHAAKSGWGLLKFAIGLLAIVLVFALAAAIAKKMGFGEVHSLASRASSGYAGSRAEAPPPVASCSTKPKDAFLVMAPAQGCSKVIVVPVGMSPCAETELIKTGKVRSKMWYGETQPAEWFSGASATGNKLCLGSTTGKPVSVPVWMERIPSS